jgi:hypothetical protein
LNQIVFYAREAGWLVLFIPNGWEHVQSGTYVKEVTLSDGKIKYDNSMMSAAALRGFWIAHADILQTLPISNHEILKRYNPVIENFYSDVTRAKSVSGRNFTSFTGILPP